MPNISTVRELLYWSYANLAMAHSALQQGKTEYGRLHYGIRKRLYAGLMDGKMNIRDLLYDEKLKMKLPQACSYCGSKDNLSADHMIPKMRGGQDYGENIVWACRRCNSSKGPKDMLEWFKARGQFPPILLLRRYLKIIVKFCTKKGLLDAKVADISKTNTDMPFDLSLVPTEYPALRELRIWVAPLEDSTIR